MNRRKFLRSVLVGAGAVAVPFVSEREAGLGRFATFAPRDEYVWVGRWATREELGSLYSTQSPELLEG